MKISSEHSAADAKEKRRQGELGFTMVEIAMAIGVIGFALVAVIGILPKGLGVQQSNREDTIIVRDAPYFMDAIRNGCVLNSNINGGNNTGLDFLTNYVEKITITNYFTPSSGATVTNWTVYPRSTSRFTSGSNIIGLLSTPSRIYANPSNYTVTTAIVRALGGPAVEQYGSGTNMSFRYQMTVEIVPFNSFAPETIEYENYPGGSADSNLCYLRWLEATPNAVPIGAFTNQPGPGALVYHLFDVRLGFSWPVLPVPGANQTYIVGRNHQTYRSMIAAKLLQNTLADGDTCWFFQPLSYSTNNYLPGS
jgi:type II secretory pathway pseudopilin PulG